MVTANLRQIIQDLILPEFRALQVEIRSVDAKIDSFREEFRSEIRRLDQRIESLQGRFGERFDSQENRFTSLEKQIQTNHESLGRQIQVMREDFKLAIDLHERIAAIEAKLSTH